MSDDPHKKRHDSTLISLQEEWEWQWECNKYNISRATLAQAISAVGHSRQAVEKWLAERGFTKRN